MPVDLSALPRPMETTPKHWPWWARAGSIVLVWLAGVAACVFFSDPAERRGADVWLRAIALSTAASAAVVGVRSLTVSHRCAHALSFNRRRESLIEEGRVFARRPLAVIGYAYETALGTEKVAQKLRVERPLKEYARDASGGSVVLGSRLAWANVDGVERSDAELLEQRYRELFRRMLVSLLPTIAALPLNVPLEIYLDVPKKVARGSAFKWFGEVSAALLKRHARICGASDEGVFALDEWLDTAAEAHSQCFRLWMSVQYLQPAEDGLAEAGVAVLLAPPDVAERVELAVAAWVHRPQRGTWDAISEVLTQAMDWGTRTMGQDGFVWTTGLASPEGARMLASAVEKHWSSSAEACVDIDGKMGNGGVTSPWLTLVLAMEQANQTGLPQLAVSMEDASAIATVVRPGRNDRKNTSMERGERST